MNERKTTAISISFALLLFGLSACQKNAVTQKTVSTAAENQAVNLPSDSLYYSNSNKAIYVVELININSKKVFTSVISPNRTFEQLNVPGYMTTGLYNVVITPEGAYSNITTHYQIGGIQDSTSKYPAVIRNANIELHNKSSVSIALY